jgi:hypothetical protein
MKRNNRPQNKHRSHSSVYSTLPAANINLGAMNVYAEVRGKYSRNANNTVNNLQQAPGILSRPSTSGSLVHYNRRLGSADDRKEVEKEPAEEAPKQNRSVNNEGKVVVKRRRVRDKEKDEEKERKKEEVVDRLVVEEEKEGGEEEEEGEKEEKSEDGEGRENDGEEGEGKEEEVDRKTEASFKTTSSQHRYIEELEKMLRMERIRRIEAEDKLQRLSTRNSRRH